MSKSLQYITLLASWIISLPLSAQYYETGQDPASLKWEIIKTEHFRIIYPTDYRNDAIRAGSIYEDAWKLISSDAPGNRALRRFPVIFHNHSIESNGYVAWAPRRMEIYPTPELPGGWSCTPVHLRITFLWITITSWLFMN